MKLRMMAGIGARIACWAAALLLVAGIGAKASDNQEIKLGAIASLTGPAGEQGRNWLQGSQLAASELNAAGEPVALLVEDDGTVPMKAAGAFHKLASVREIKGIIGGTWDYLAEAIYPLAKHYRIPVITPTNPVEILSPSARENPWVYTNGMSLAAEKKAIRELFRELKIRTVALVYPNLPWGTMHARILDELIAEFRLNLVLREEFPMEAYLEGVKVAALKVASKKPDIVYAPISYEGLDVLATVLRNLQVQQRLLVSQHLDEALRMAKDVSVYSQAYGVYPRVVLDQGFAQRFRQKFGSEPKVYAAEGYDAVMFLVKALRAGVDFGSAQGRFSYRGLTGEFRLPPNGRSLVESEAVIMAGEGSSIRPWSPH